MLYYTDLILEDTFRDFAINRISDNVKYCYEIPLLIPELYRYRPLSEYAIEDIMNKQITISSIGEFNDIFDGAIQLPLLKEKIEEEAKQKWSKLEELRKEYYLPEGIINKDKTVAQYIDKYKTESKLKFRELDYLGTYVCCFSEDNKSNLMWSHYADSNRGICIEYDFNLLPSEGLFRKTLFPIAYMKEPLNVEDLLEDDERLIYDYPIDAAVLCTGITKADVWRYEREWRSFWVIEFAKEERYIPIKLGINPSRVLLGYHFLKNFFWYDRKDYDVCKDNIERFVDLLSFIKENGIYVSIMAPDVGSYSLKPYDISVDKLLGFIHNSFARNDPSQVRFYYTIHDALMNLLLF